MVSGKRCICVLSNLLNVMRINRDLEAKKGLLYNERWKLKKLQIDMYLEHFTNQQNIQEYLCISS